MPGPEAGEPANDQRRVGIFLHSPLILLGVSSRAGVSPANRHNGLPPAGATDRSDAPPLLAVPCSLRAATLISILSSSIRATCLTTSADPKHVVRAVMATELLLGRVLPSCLFRNPQSTARRLPALWSTRSERLARLSWSPDIDRPLDVWPERQRDLAPSSRRLVRGHQNLQYPCAMTSGRRRAPASSGSGLLRLLGRHARWRSPFRRAGQDPARCLLLPGRRVIQPSRRPAGAVRS